MSEAPDPLAAGALGGSLPPLLIAAERVAATVAQGVHGRRRVGTGENFWQFRPFVTGDPTARIDWRRSGRSDQLFLRETEWEAAQTLALWCQADAAMAWRSADTLPTKAGRAGLLLLALASLALRGGERVRLLDRDNANAAGITAGGGALPRLATALAHAGPGLPQALPPAFAQVVLFGDWLDDLGGITTLLGKLSALPARGLVVQVLDPAEVALPYAGRVRFVLPGAPLEATIGRVEALRDAYQARLAEQQNRLSALCANAGFRLLVHHTDAPATPTLLALHEALSGPA